MLRHIVMWKLKEPRRGADRAVNARRLKRSWSRARPCRASIKFEVALAQPGLEATYDVCCTPCSADKASLDAYQVIRSILRSSRSSPP